MSVVIDDAVRRKALALGAKGERWLAELPDRVARLCEQWDLTLGEPLPGGSTAFVAAVEARGRPAVVKLSIPDDGSGGFRRELTGLRLGQGRGMVAILAEDDEGDAVLLERLGAPMSRARLTVEEMADAIATTLAPLWQPLPDGVEIRTGTAQLLALRDYVASAWEAQGRSSCSRDVVAQAESCATSRLAAHEAATPVLIHGDAHEGNVMADREHAGRWRLVDPDPMASTPEHDLGIPLRDWTEPLLASNEPAELAWSWCARLADRTGADRRGIWEWAFLERVSTGLYMTELGIARGRDLLAVAERLVGPTPS